MRTGQIVVTGAAGDIGAPVVSAIFFPASPDADCLSGQTADVDGGKHMP